MLIVGPQTGPGPLGATRATSEAIQMSSLAQKTATEERAAAAAAAKTKSKKKCNVRLGERLGVHQP